MRHDDLLRPAAPISRRGSSTLAVVQGPLSARAVQEWDELVERAALTPWLTPGWLLPWWQHMGAAPPLLWELRSSSGALRAVLPLQAGARAVVSPTNWHTPEFGVAAEDDEARRELLARAVSRGAARLTMDFVPGKLADEVLEVCAAEKTRAFSRVLESSPYLPFGSGWEGDLSSHLLADLRRRARRLAERGEVAFEVQDGTAHLDRLLDEGLQVEASGWKGRAGTAVLCQPETLAFYRAVTRWAAERGLLRLAFLRLDGRAIAFDLTIEHAGVCYLLKNGYDESERAVAPGKQLRLGALRHFAERGVTCYEFLGDALEWKREWTPFRKDRFQVHAFGGGIAGGGEWALHARMLPLARSVRDSSVAAQAVKAARAGAARVRR